MNKVENLANPFLRRLLLVCALAVTGVSTAVAGGDWNDGKIAWKQYEPGLAAAKEQNKPICLIFYTEWCPHCTAYSAVFHDPAVVERAQRFVMIRVDKDKNRELSRRYAPDGEYIPRTFFLSSAGELAAEIRAPRDRYVYFYDERDPTSVLRGMDAALERQSTTTP